MEKAIPHVGLDVHAIAVASLVEKAKEPIVSVIPTEAKVIRCTFKRLAEEAYELKCC